MSSLSNPIAIATTPAALRTLVPYCTAAVAPLLIPEKLAGEVAQYAATGLQSQYYPGSLREALGKRWGQHDGFVFALATGAVVRLIAPLLQDKTTDPAVVVVDEAGQFAISLCGGHQRGADALAREVSQYLQATPVLTGSANQLHLPALDLLGQPWGWNRGSGNWTAVSSAIARGEAVQVIQEAGADLWRRALPPDHPFQFDGSEESDPAREIRPAPQGRVWISPIQREFPPEAGLPQVQWHPRVLWVGVGCERGTSQALIDWGIRTVCQSHHLALGAIAGLASLDLKADEVGLVNLGRDRNWPLRCFTAETLQQIAVPNPSAVVEQAVGTPSVAEAAAIAAAAIPLGPHLSSVPTLPNDSHPPTPLCVTKQVMPSRPMSSRGLALPARTQ